MRDTHSQLKKSIMRRIYVVAFMKRFLRPFVMKSTFLFVFVVMGMSFVSVTNVIKNALYSSNGFFDVVSFILHALARTEFFIQVLFVGIITLILWLIMDAGRSFLLLGNGRRQIIS